MVNVVLHTAFVGDLLLSIPLLRQIKRLEPEQPLILVCRPGLAEFFLKNKIVDQVIELNKKKSSSVRDFKKFIRNQEIHWLFCVHESFRSAWLLRDVKAQHKVSYTHWWNKPFFDIRVTRPMDLPEATRALHLLAPFDATLKQDLAQFSAEFQRATKVANSSVEAWPYKIPKSFDLRTEASPTEIKAIHSRLGIREPYAVIAPSSQWATKRWTNSGFVEVIHRLLKKRLNIYLIGTPSEKNHCDELANLSGSTNASGTVTQMTTYEVRSIAGQTTLADLHALLSQAEVVVTNDSGPMHMATAAGRPVVAVFGPTTLNLGYRPWSDQSYVAQVELSCRPCGKHGHNKCPIGTHDCMKKVTADDVMKGVEAVTKDI